LGKNPAGTGQNQQGPETFLFMHSRQPGMAQAGEIRIYQLAKTGISSKTARSSRLDRLARIGDKSGEKMGTGCFQIFCASASKISNLI
jgi:hypothetical protein